MPNPSSQNPLLTQIKNNAKQQLQKTEQAEQALTALEKTGLQDPELKTRIRNQKARLKAIIGLSV